MDQKDTVGSIAAEIVANGVTQVLSLLVHMTAIAKVVHIICAQTFPGARGPTMSRLAQIIASQ